MREYGRPGRGMGQREQRRRNRGKRRGLCRGGHPRRPRGASVLVPGGSLRASAPFCGGHCFPHQSPLAARLVLERRVAGRFAPGIAPGIAQVRRRRRHESMGKAAPAQWRKREQKHLGVCGGGSGSGGDPVRTAAARDHPLPAAPRPQRRRRHAGHTRCTWHARRRGSPSDFFLCSAGLPGGASSPVPLHDRDGPSGERAAAPGLLRERPEKREQRRPPRPPRRLKQRAAAASALRALLFLRCRRLLRHLLRRRLRLLLIGLVLFGLGRRLRRHGRRWNQARQGRGRL